MTRSIRAKLSAALGISRRVPGIYTARKGGDLIFRSIKDERGLYYLFVEYLQFDPYLAGVSAAIRGDGTSCAVDLRSTSVVKDRNRIRHFQGTALSRVLPQGMGMRAGGDPTQACLLPAREYFLPNSYQTMNATPHSPLTDLNHLCLSGGRLWWTSSVH